MPTQEPRMIRPALDASGAPAIAPEPDHHSVSDPGDVTTMADTLLEVEGPDVEASSTCAADHDPENPHPAQPTVEETDPLRPSPIDPDLDAPDKDG